MQNRKIGNILIAKIFENICKKNLKIFLDKKDLKYIVLKIIKFIFIFTSFMKKK